MTAALYEHELFDQYPQFYGNPIIGELSESPRWTVSDNQKVPIDVRALQRNEGLWGAKYRTIQCLMTLEELVDFLPNAANHAFALNSSLDQVLVLDIERDCDPELAAEMLRLPALYSELSMSGLGYHLVMPLPENFADYPIATTKPKLQDPKKQYEILIDHWITFTRRPIPDERFTLESYNEAAGAQRWAELYAQLASNAQEAPVVTIDVERDRPDIPGIELACAVLTRDGLVKSLQDFHGDHSRFEFSTLGTLYARLQPLLPFLTEQFDFEYTPSDQAWILYDAISKLIPPRPKHDEYRNGMPLLLNAATALIARRKAQRQTQSSTAV